MENFFSTGCRGALSRDCRLTCGKSCVKSDTVVAWLFGSRSIRTRLEDLESTVNSLKSSHKAIQLEWENTYQKLHAQRVSIAKRARDLEKASEDAPGSTNGNQPPTPGPSDVEMLRRAFPRR